MATPATNTSPQTSHGSGFLADARHKLRDFFLDPKVYVPVILGVAGFLGMVIYDYFKPQVAQHVATLIADAENFRTKDENGNSVAIPNPVYQRTRDSLVEDDRFLTAMTARFLQQEGLQDQVFGQTERHLNRSDTFPEVVVEAIIKARSERLRTRVRQLISEEITRLTAIEAGYGRVDQIFRKSFSMKGTAERDDLLAKFEFLAEPNQQVFVRLVPTYTVNRPDGEPWVEKIKRSFLVKGVEEVSVESDATVNVTDLIAFDDDHDDIQLVELVFWPTKGVRAGDKLTVDATIIVRNFLPSTLPDAGAVIAAGKPDSNPALPND